MLPAGVRLIHVRHGETDWNAEGRLQGQLDIPMNEHGRSQAARNAATLAAQLSSEGVDPASLSYVSSPLSRSAETMAIVRKALALPGTAPTDDRLREVSFGLWSGHTYEELKQTDARSLVAARKRDKWSFRPPEGETYADLAARVGAWLETVAQDTVAVTHGGVFRVLHGLLAGTPWHDVPNIPAPQDRYAIFYDGTVELR
ncbi:MAG: histidine phosphatase family protein [Pseudomonadota bacterium]